MLTNEISNELKTIIPKCRIFFEEELRHKYSQDAFCTYGMRSLADVIIFVEKINEVQRIVSIANENRIPVICRGAGTNTVGACITENGGIVLDFSRMKKILEINKENMTARVQPGVIVGDLQKRVEEFGLYYPPDPSNLEVSTIGGSIAQNSAGARTFKYGSTKDYVIDLTVVTADGEIMKTGSNTIKNSTGYNLTSIFVGSEGTLGIVVEATLKLIVKPQTSKVLMAYFNSLAEATDAVTAIIQNKLQPTTIDFMDKNAIQTVEKYSPIGLMSEKDALLIIEVDGFENAVCEQIESIVNILKLSKASNISVAEDESETEKIWMARRSSFNTCAKLKPYMTTDDVIVPRENIAKLVGGIDIICKKYNLLCCMVGHIGDGSVHPQIPVDFDDEIERENYKLAKKEIYDLTKRLNGILSGEHGIGFEKREYIEKFVDLKALSYMKKLKRMFDENNILNPNKIFKFN